MRMKCSKCALEGDFVEFPYIGRPGSAGVEHRRCPRCGSLCVLDRGDSLDDEREEMRVLVDWLSAIPGNAPRFLLEEAREVISRLSSQNRRWNVPALDEFLMQRQKELGLVS